MSFAGIQPILHTPFSRADGRPVALTELGDLTRRMADVGAAGVVALGLASEAAALSEGERDASIEAAVAAAGELPVTVGIDGDADRAARRARRAVELGAAAVMVLAPRGDGRRASLIAHFEAVATAGVPVLAQDSPQVTGAELTADDLLALGEAVPEVRAVKIEGSDAGAKISRLTARGMDVVAGWGGLQYPEVLERGAIGLMPGCDLAAAFVAVHELWCAGGHDRARALYHAVLPYLVYEAQSLRLLILAAKRRLVQTGVFGDGGLRDPDAGLDAIQVRWLDRCADALGAAAVPGWESER